MSEKQAFFEQKLMKAKASLVHTQQENVQLEQKLREAELR